MIEGFGKPIRLDWNRNGGVIFPKQLYFEAIFLPKSTDKKNAFESFYVELNLYEKKKKGYRIVLTIQIITI